MVLDGCDHLEINCDLLTELFRVFFFFVFKNKKKYFRLHILKKIP